MNHQNLNIDFTESGQIRAANERIARFMGLETAFDLWADCESIHADDQREQLALEIEEKEAEIERLENITTTEDLKGIAS